MYASERIDLELRGLNLVDVSSENDTLIDLQSEENQNNNISSGLVAVDAEKAVDTTDISEQMEQLPQSSEPLEPERSRKIGKCNLRKSLAWDTAFFTSAGVLEPDELSSMIKGVGKGGKHFLPGIEEDIHRSTDSISTLGSESLTMESLEVDLFEDIRASIQKSSKASNMASSSKAASGGTETQVICSLNKVDHASKNMMKSKPASKKQNIGLQGPGKLIKQSSGCSQGTQPMARNGGLTSSFLKAPKVIGRPNPISSTPLKRASSGAKQVEMENYKTKGASVVTVPGKVTPVSKIHGMGGSIRIVPKPALSSKSFSSSSSTTTKKPPRSSSSCDSSHSATSPNVGISPVKSNRRIVKPTSSSSIRKTPSKVALKKKGQPNLSAYLMSSELSSNSSPASSISEWSSKSSSSTYTVNKRSNTSRASIGTSSPCRSLGSDAPPALDHHNQSNDQISDIHENKVKRLPSENLQIGALSRPAKGQPSGLRMPSPKIGFFDGVKPVVRTPTGSMQSHSGIPAGPKIGAGISRPAAGNMKLDSRKPASPLPSQKASNASPKVSSVSGGLKKCPSISPQVQTQTNGERCWDAEEVRPKGPDKANGVPDTGLDAERTGSRLGVFESEINFKKQGNPNIKDVEIAPIEGNSCALSSHCSAENIKLSEEGGEDALSSLQHLKTKLMVYKSNEKENAHFEDQVDGLSMHVGAMDSKQKLQNELVGNSITQIDFSYPDPPVPELSCSKEFFVPDQKEGSLSDLSEPTPITRTPFAVTNSLGNSEGDFSTRLSVGLVEKTAPLSSLKIAQTENS